MEEVRERVNTRPDQVWALLDEALDSLQGSRWAQERWVSLSRGYRWLASLIEVGVEGTFQMLASSASFASRLAPFLPRPCGIAGAEKGRMSRV